MSKSERAKIEKRISRIEVEVAELEQQMKTIENSLAVPPADPSKVQELGSNYTALQGRIEDLMQEWTVEHIRLEENGESS
jgi:predicted  nucleic acid-binding Zn-ribbon protein